MHDTGTAVPSVDEPARQRVLDRYRILDTLPEEAYDDIVKVASVVCETPVALVSLIDRERQWFKARLGFDDTQTAREVAVCDHAIREPGKLMEIPDLRQDARFAAFPAVSGDAGARFYAGMPLVSPEGAALGTVCVIDHLPRALTAAQRDALEALARITIALMESGRRERSQAASEALHTAAPPRRRKVRISPWRCSNCRTTPDWSTAWGSVPPTVHWMRSTRPSIVACGRVART